MSSYEKLYKTLFNSLTDAIMEIDKDNYGAAREILVKAQQTAEDEYIEQVE